MKKSQDIQLSTECQEMILDQHNRGRFVNRADAKQLLEDYFLDEGSRQPPRGAPDHVFGHLFGLNCLREFLLKIDRHNTETANADEQFTAVRIYRARSKRGAGPLSSDLIMVPVKRNGQDFPKGLPEALADPNIYLTGSGPCPNVCGELYFYL